MVKISIAWTVPSSLKPAVVLRRCSLVVVGVSTPRIYWTDHSIIWAWACMASYRVL